MRLSGYFVGRENSSVVRSLLLMTSPAGSFGMLVLCAKDGGINNIKCKVHVTNVNPQ